MTAKKSFKKGDTVLTCKKLVKTKDAKGRKIEFEQEFKVSPTSFSAVDFYGVTILEGEDYYIKKAVALGAKK